MQRKLSISSSITKSGYMLNIPDVEQLCLCTDALERAAESKLTHAGK
jgi:hypothetical protein